MNSKLSNTEEHISDQQDRITEIIQSELKKEQI